MTSSISSLWKALSAAWLLAAASALLFLPAQAAAQTAKRPNFILFIADDMGWDDCGAYGNEAVRTPNLDRLAREGMKFNNSFLTTSSCSPSRASIITGRYPHSTGAQQLHMPLPASQTTFVELLKNAGYWTAAAGKWHLGPHVKDRFHVVKEGGGKSGCEQWVSTLESRPKDQPFFLWLAALDPHRAYDENAIPRPHKPEEVVVPPYLPDMPETRRDLALYYDEITRLDSYVGDVLAELDRQGERDNTLVLFITDNGRPFPRCKTTLYDSGIKTPWIVRWPARVAAGTNCNQIVSSVDIAPTFTALAGLVGAESFQGKNFAPLLDNPRKPIRDFVHAEKNWHDFDDHVRAVRSRQYKYIRNYYTDIPSTPPADAVRSITFQAMRALRDAGKLPPEQMTSFVVPRPAEEFYDMEKDPHELRNLAGDPKLANLIQKYRAELARFEEATDDKVPEKRTPDGFDRESGASLSARKPAKK